MQGHLRQRGKAGIYYAVFDDGRDETGKRRQRWVNLQTTSKRAAERELAKLIAKQTEGMLPPPNSQTLAKYLRVWLDTRRTAGRAESTVFRYERLIERRIIPTLGHIKLADLRPTHLEQHYARELASPRLDGKPGTLAPRTVHFQHQILHAALKQAVLQGLIPRNPADAVTPPQPARGEQTPLTPDQAAVLLQAVSSHRLAPLYYLAITTGMRAGELLGLRWSDVDLDAAMLTVRVQRQYLPGKGIREKVTKEHRGDRPIELTPEEVDALRKHAAAQAAERLRIGPMWQDHGLVFPSEIGTPMQARNLSRHFKSLLKHAGLPDIRFHDLRHTAGTLLMREDSRVVIAQRRLGHKDPATTSRLYGHALPGDQRDAAGKVADVLRRASAVRKAK